MEDMTPDCSAMKPRGPGTLPPIQTSCSNTQPHNSTSHSLFNFTVHSGQSTAQPAVHHRSQQTRGPVTSWQPSPTPQSSSLKSRQRLNHGKQAATLRRQTVLCKTLINTIYICGTVVVNAIQPYGTSITICISIDQLLKMVL